MDWENYISECKNNLNIYFRHDDNMSKFHSANLSFKN